MAPVLRFAPSPTGRIHIGNARTALLNWCVAKRAGGRTFILRFDDTDQERSRKEYADAIAVDLAWLGIDPDRHGAPVRPGSPLRCGGRAPAGGRAALCLLRDGG